MALPNQLDRCLIIQIVKEIPQQDAIKSQGRIVKVLLDPTDGPMPAALSVQEIKHVADRELFHPAQKKIDIAARDQAQI